jgi:uncharacterized protein (DUF952 family)
LSLPLGKRMAIYHIVARSAWEAAQPTGAYAPASLVTEGFIHFSQRQQVVRTANLFYHGQPDLVLLVVDPVRLPAEIRYETPPDSPEKFPHLYGPLNTDAVIAVVDFPPQPDGTFSLPDRLP